MTFSYKLLLFFLIGLLIVQSSSQSVYPYSCLEYKSSECTRCPPNTHIYNNQCYNNTVGCLQYQNGDQCNKCNTTYTYLFNNTCVTLVQGAQLQKYTISSTLGDQYGQTNFAFISLINAQTDKYFTLCDNFMRTGEYSHFISKAAQPIISVQTYDINNTRRFKILYEGSGGEIFLCLIGFNMITNNIELRSFVVISYTQIVDLCIDYTDQLQCARCQDGYHLENGVCYLNVPNCLRYFKNICIQCKNYSLLSENRCIADCSTLKDTRSIKFYNNYVTGNAIPNIQRIYSSN